MMYRLVPEAGKNDLIKSCKTICSLRRSKTDENEKTGNLLEKKAVSMTFLINIKLGS